MIKKQLAVAIACALCVTVNQRAYAANDIEIVSGAELTNITQVTEADSSESFTSSNDSALLGIDNLVIFNPRPPIISISTSDLGTNSELGNLTLSTDINFDLYGVDYNRYDFSAHNNIILSSYISDKDLSTDWNSIILNLNPDSDANGSGEVILNGSIEGNVDTTITGSLIIGATGTYNLDGSLDYRTSLTVDSIDNTAGGTFNFSSGSLNLTGSGLTIGADELLGDSVILSNRMDLSVADDVTVESGASLVFDSSSYSTNSAATFSSNLLNSGSVSVNGYYADLEVAGNIINDGSAGEGITTLDGGTLTANNIINTNGGELDFVSGDLYLSGVGITVGTDGLLGNDVVLNSSRELYVADDIVVESGASLTVDSGYMGMEFVDYVLDVNNDVNIINNGDVSFNGGYFMVSGTSTNDGGSMVLDGGILYTDSISNINGGTFDFISGRLELNESDLTIGSTGLLGDAYANTSSRSAYIKGDVTIDADASLTINSGDFTANSITNNGSFSFNSGHLRLGSDLNIGATGLLGEADSILTSSRALSLSGDVTVDENSSLSINGGRFVADNIVNNGSFNFSAGYIDLNGVNNVIIGDTGLFGNALVLDNVRHLDVASEVLVEAGANLTINNDNSSNITDFGALTNNGNVNITDESLNVAGDITTNASGFTSFNGDSSLIDGERSTLTANSVVNTNGGKFNFVSGDIEIAGDQVIGSSGLVNNLAREPDSKLLRLTVGRTLSVAGDVTVESDAILELNFNSLNDATTFSSNLLNNGNVNIIGGTLNVGENIINDGLLGAGHMETNGGRISFVNMINTNGGTFTNNGGYLSNIESIENSNGGSTIHNSGNFTVSNITNNAGSYVLNGGSLYTGNITNTAGGSFQFNSGYLRIEGDQGLTIGDTGALGNALEITDGRSLNVFNDVTVDLGGSLSFTNTDSYSNSTSFGADLINNGNIDIASHRLNVAGAVVNDGGVINITNSLSNNNYSGLYVDNITNINGGTFNFDSGLLALTGAGINIGDAGLLGNTVELSADRELAVMGDINVATDASLSITGGKQGKGYNHSYPVYQYFSSDQVSNLNNSGSVSITGGNFYTDAVINSGSGNLTLNGGSLSADSITNIDNGTFDFISGSLALNATGLNVGTGGLLGSTVDLTGTRRVSINGNANIEAGASLTINGGSQSFGSITDTGNFEFNSGSLSLTDSGLTVGTTGLLGENVSLTDTRQLSVSGELVINNGATLAIDGGTFKTEGITNNGNFAFNSGRLEMIGVNGYTVGAGSLLGSDLVLSGSKSLVVGGDMTIDTDSSIFMTTDAGNYSSINYFDSNLLNSGDINISAGHLFVGDNGGDVINDGTASQGNMVLDGGALYVNNISNINGGTFDFVSGQLTFTGDLNENHLVIGDGGLLGSSVVLSGDRSLEINTHYYNASGDSRYRNSTTQVEAGADLSITGGYQRLANLTNDGSVNINMDINSYENVNLGDVTNNGSFVISGVNSDVYISEITNNGSFSFSSGRLSLSSGIVIGSGGLLGSNVGLSADRRLHLNSSSRIDSGASLSVSGGDHYVNRLTNAGSVVVSGGRLETYGLTNTGTVNITAGVLDTRWSQPLNNSGTVNVSGGELRTDSINNEANLNVSSGAQVVATGDVTNSGRVDIQTGGTLEISSSSVDRYTQLGGLTHVDGTLNADDVLILGGRLTGAGTINGNLTIDDNGHYNPGNSPGTMQIVGDFVLTETGTLHLEAGIDADTGEFVWDELIVGGDYQFEVGSFIEVSLLDGMSIDSFADDFGMDNFFRTGDETTNETVSLTTGIFDTVDLYAFEEDVTGAKTWYSLEFDSTGEFATAQTVAPLQAVPVPAAIWLFGSGLIGLFGVAGNVKLRN